MRLANSENESTAPGRYQHHVTLMPRLIFMNTSNTCLRKATDHGELLAWFPLKVRLQRDVQILFGLKIGYFLNVIAEGTPL